MFSVPPLLHSKVVRLVAVFFLYKRINPFVYLFLGSEIYGIIFNWIRNILISRIATTNYCGAYCYLQFIQRINQVPNCYSFGRGIDVTTLGVMMCRPFRAN